MGKKFNSIIFDLGGVLYDIDVQLSVKAFEELELKSFDGLYSLKEQTLLFDDLETGVIDKAEFVKRINHFSGLSLDEKQIVNAWNSLLIGIKPETISLLSALKEDYDVFLLSNTNEIHLDCINKYMQVNFGIDNLSSLFNKAYYSCRLGMRKPGKEIYEYIIQDAGIDPATCIFIDDNKDNIASGNRAGIFSVLMERGANLKTLLNDQGIITISKTG